MLKSMKDTTNNGKSFLENNKLHGLDNGNRDLSAIEGVETNLATGGRTPMSELMSAVNGKPVNYEEEVEKLKCKLQGLILSEAVNVRSPSHVKPNVFYHKDIRQRSVGHLGKARFYRVVAH